MEDKKAFIRSKTRNLSEHEEHKLIEEEQFKTQYRTSRYSPESIEPEKEKEIAEIENSEKEYRTKLRSKHTRQLKKGEKIWGEE